MPDIGKRGLRDVATVNIRVAAWLYNSRMGNETETGARQTAPSDGIQSVRLKIHGFPLFLGSLA